MRLEGSHLQGQSCNSATRALYHFQLSPSTDLQAEAICRASTSLVPHVLTNIHNAHLHTGMYCLQFSEASLASLNTQTTIQRIYKQPNNLNQCYAVRCE